ncbi:MAG: hypothetical protein M2R45_05475 [Verrucomicrobia subdivision 3 bacterium]|nr:hypothetical protein [Limisphaerales bacterium]
MITTPAAAGRNKNARPEKPRRARYGSLKDYKMAALTPTGPGKKEELSAAA